MVIWIVEDDDDDAGKAYDVVTGVANEKTGKSSSHSVKLYRVKLIEWPPELRVLGESENRIETDFQKARPSIVILDIYDRGSERQSFWKAYASGNTTWQKQNRLVYSDFVHSLFYGRYGPMKTRSFRSCSSKVDATGESVTPKQKTLSY
jgi:hypothetical protein